MATAYTWDLWIPDAASRGISFARGVSAPADRLLVHAPPSVLRVEVRDHYGVQIALGDGLERSAESPMAILEVRGDRVARQDHWPSESDIGGLVILPGGELGRLTAWWNADDHSEWRWSVEFYNHR